MTLPSSLPFNIKDFLFTEVGIFLEDLISDDPNSGKIAFLILAERGFPYLSETSVTLNLYAILDSKFKSFNLSDGGFSIGSRKLSI